MNLRAVAAAVVVQKVREGKLFVSNENERERGKSCRQEGEGTLQARRGEVNYDPARMKKLAFHFLSLNGEDEVIFLLRRTDDLAEVLFFFSFEDLAMSERSRERGRCRAGKSGTEK